MRRLPQCLKREGGSVPHTGDEGRRSELRAEEENKSYFLRLPMMP